MNKKQKNVLGIFIFMGVLFSMGTGKYLYYIPSSIVVGGIISVFVLPK